MSPIDQMIEWQREAKAYIDAGGPDSRGAWAGMLDSLAEECLLRMEE